MGRTNKRLALVMGLALLFLVGLMGRTFYVQVIAAPALRDKADTQSTRVIKLDAPRGTIYDRDGGQLAVSRRMATVFANPKQIEDPVTVAGALAPILDKPEEEILTRLTKDSGFEYLARKIEPAKGEQVKALELVGVGVLAEDKRFYPSGALAPQVLGFVGMDNVGLAGIEKEYDRVLSGIPGELTVVSDRLGNRLDTTSSVAAIPGRSIRLTIDRDIQFEAEKVLAETVEEFEAKAAFAVVLDPRNGEVLAMANTPTFDTNQYGSVEEQDRRNSIVVDMHEPGSTFKLIAVAAALEEGLVSPDTVYRLGKEIEVYDRVVHEAKKNIPAVRELTVTEILSQSSNVGAVKLGMEVGKSRLVKTIKDFGFTQKLGIDFPGEASGLMLAPEKWSGTTIANVPIGHGISVTPLQLAAAYAAIANDGVLVQPHLVMDRAEPHTHRAVGEKVARQLRSMLTMTVEEGTGKQARVKGYDVAGKTGTAQKVMEGGGYADDRFMSSFVGMVPAHDPRLVILVMVDEPATEHLGAIVAAPAFSRIAAMSLRALGIPPTSLD